MVIKIVRSQRKLGISVDSMFYRGLELMVSENVKKSCIIACTGPCIVHACRETGFQIG